MPFGHCLPHGKDLRGQTSALGALLTEEQERLIYLNVEEVVRWT